MITIREYELTDKSAVMNLIRLNTPRYFTPEEEAGLSRYLDSERELYYVLLFNEKIVGCGGGRRSISENIFRLQPDYRSIFR